MSSQSDYFESPCGGKGKVESPCLRSSSPYFESPTERSKCSLDDTETIPREYEVEAIPPQRISTPPVSGLSRPLHFVQRRAEGGRIVIDNALSPTDSDNTFSLTSFSPSTQLGQETDDEQSLSAEDHRSLALVGHETGSSNSNDIQRFSTEAEFRTYFVNRPELIRLLATRYTLAESWEDMRQTPLFHLKNEVSSEALQAYFFNMFTANSFALQGRSVIAIHPRLREVATVLAQHTLVAESTLKANASCVKEMKRRQSAARKAEKRQKYLQRSPKYLATRNVYTYIRSTISQNLSADGGDTNAELTEHTAKLLVDTLCAIGALHQDSVFMDGGCAYNVFCSHIAQVVGCRVWGIEYVATRCYLATANMLRALRDPKNIGSLVNPKIAFVPLDLRQFTSFGPTTIAYFFDEAFPLSLIEHNCLAAANTPSLNYIVSYKASKRRSIHEVFTRHGFDLLPSKVKVTKCGGEQNTAYVYERRTGVAAKAPPPHRSHERGTVTNKQLMEKYLMPAWCDDPNVRLRHYKMLNQLCKAQIGHRRRTVTISDCGETLRERNMLCLGMIYADTGTTTDDIVSLVRDGIITPAMGRDTARCLAIETLHDVRVYSLARESHPKARGDRHIKTDLSSRKSIEDIRQVFSHGVFEQIVLDYFWMPKGYVHERMGRSFFGTQLRRFAQELLCEGGEVYLPFHIDILRSLSMFEASWIPYYQVTFVSQNHFYSMRKNMLWDATRTISPETMHWTFQKDADQLDTYCRVQQREIRSASLPEGSKLSEMIANDLDGIANYRFIALRTGLRRPTDTTG